MTPGLVPCATAASAVPAGADGEWARDDWWWPLALVPDVLAAGRVPVPVTLLSAPWAIVVLDGRIAVLGDRCPHRRVPLLAGSVADSSRGQVLECGYHGWSFGADGECVRIPALGEGPPPRGMGGPPALAVRVQAGLVWGRRSPLARSSAAPGRGAAGTAGPPEPPQPGAQRVAAPAAEAARALAGSGAVPGRILRVRGTRRLRFAIRPETAASSVVFPLPEGPEGHAEWQRALADRGLAATAMPAAPRASQRNPEER